MRGLRGQVALVTGAAQGIGEGIARRFGAEGMDVALVDINGVGAKVAADAIAKDTGARTIALVGDVSVEDDAREVVRACSAAFGRLTVLVNNAGVDGSASPSRLSRAMWQRVHDVDLWGSMLMVRESESLLAEHGGTVVNIASNHALATVAERAAYAAAKAGVLGLARGLAIDLGPKGIRVNTILPGYIRTPIWRLWLDDAPDPEALLARIARRHPVRRLGTPADVAGVAAFLCSDDATFITGATLVVDGGNTAMLEYPLE